MKVEDRGRKVAAAGAFVVALAVAVLFVVGLVRDGGTGTPSVVGGVVLDDTGLGRQPHSDCALW